MDIRIDEQLWATSMAPEGVLERWRIADGGDVRQGQPIADVRIEDYLHEIIAPVSGKLAHMVADGALVEPGTLIGQVAG